MQVKKTGIQNRQLVNTSNLYRSKVLDIVVEDLILPNGQQTEIVMVRHPGSTAIIPMDEEGNVVMIRQYRPVVDRYLLEIPAGTMDPGEDPLDCARRELEEETGLQARELSELMAVDILPSYSDEKIYIFLARGLTHTQTQMDPDEIITTETHSPETLLEMIHTGRLTDALSILAIQHAFFIPGLFRSQEGSDKRLPVKPAP